MLGVPYYNYSRPQNPILIIEAPILPTPLKAEVHAATILCSYALINHPRCAHTTSPLGALAGQCTICLSA